MIHLRARRLLSQLPDGALDRRTELEVRVHVASCARCRTRLHQLQVSEELLRRIPPSILPVQQHRGAYVRLAALSRWSGEDEIMDPEGWRLSALGVASALMLVLLAATANTWAPSIEPSLTGVNLDSLPLQSAYFPNHYASR